jgi:hypothetical protein
MQLPLPADVLVPLGIGAVVVVVAVTALVLGLRRRGDESPAPTHADWTGENVGVVAVPARQEPAVAVKRTVADAIAARRADTDPFPAVPHAAALAGIGATPEPERPNGGARTSAAPTRSSAGPKTSVATLTPTRSPAEVGAEAKAGAPGSQGTGEQGVYAFGASPVRPSASPRPTPGPAPTNGDSAGVPPSPEPAPGVAGAAATVPGSPAKPPADGQDQVAAPGPATKDAADPDQQSRHAAKQADSAEAAAHGSKGHDSSDPAAPTAIPHQSSIAAGSSRNLGNAVAHVLAARAANPSAAPPPAPSAAPSPAPSTAPDRRRDARDRLLAVLLDDPLRAVGATVDLQDCQERMERLTGALNDERTRLCDVLGRLAHSGLRADQLARLSGLSDSEVAEILRRKKRP